MDDPRYGQTPWEKRVWAARFAGISLVCWVVGVFGLVTQSCCWFALPLAPIFAIAGVVKEPTFISLATLALNVMMIVYYFAFVM